MQASSRGRTAAAAWLRNRNYPDSCLLTAEQKTLADVRSIHAIA
jgi:hypothetical protein